MMNEHDIKVCKRILRHLRKSTDHELHAVPAVYQTLLPPAEALRRQADDIEDRDADIDAFRKMVAAAETFLEIKGREST